MGGFEQAELSPCIDQCRSSNRWSSCWHPVLRTIKICLTVCKRLCVCILSLYLQQNPSSSLALPSFYSCIIVWPYPSNGDTRSIPFRSIVLSLGRSSFSPRYVFSAHVVGVTLHCDFGLAASRSAATVAVFFMRENCVTEPAALLYHGGQTTKIHLLPSQLYGLNYYKVSQWHL